MNNHRNGGRKTNRSRKNHAKVAQKLRWCSLFSLISAVWYITNSFQRDKRSIAGTIWEYYGVYLKKSVKIAELWKKNSWILHDDNALLHRTTIVNEVKAKNVIATFDQSPHSPDLVPCDFFLFPELKLPLCRSRFESTEAIKQNSSKELKAVPKSAYKNISKIGKSTGICV